MFRVVEKILILSMLSGLMILLGTAGISDLKAIFIQFAIGFALLYGGYIGLKRGGSDYVD